MTNERLTVADIANLRDSIYWAATDGEDLDSLNDYLNKLVEQANLAASPEVNTTDMYLVYEDLDGSHVHQHWADVVNEGTLSTGVGDDLPIIGWSDVSPNLRSQLLEVANSLVGENPDDPLEQEYLRGMAELIAYFTVKEEVEGLPSDSVAMITDQIIHFS